MPKHPSDPMPQASAPRRAWKAPRVIDLPRLTAPTLRTGPGIPGGPGLIP